MEPTSSSEQCSFKSKEGADSEQDTDSPDIQAMQDQGPASHMFCPDALTGPNPNSPDHSPQLPGTVSTGCLIAVDDDDDDDDDDDPFQLQALLDMIDVSGTPVQAIQALQPQQQLCTLHVLLPPSFTASQHGFIKVVVDILQPEDTSSSNSPMDEPGNPQRHKHPQQQQEDVDQKPLKLVPIPSVPSLSLSAIPGTPWWSSPLEMALPQPHPATVYLRTRVSMAAKFAGIVPLPDKQLTFDPQPFSLSQLQQGDLQPSATAAAARGQGGGRKGGRPKGGRGVGFAAGSSTGGTTIAAVQLPSHVISLPQIPSSEAAKASSSSGHGKEGKQKGQAGVGEQQQEQQEEAVSHALRAALTHPLLQGVTSYADMQQGVEFLQAVLVSPLAAAAVQQPAASLATMSEVADDLLQHHSSSLMELVSGCCHWVTNGGQEEGDSGGALGFSSCLAALQLPDATAVQLLLVAAIASKLLGAAAAAGAGEDMTGMGQQAEALLLLYALLPVLEGKLGSRAGPEERGDLERQLGKKGGAAAGEKQQKKRRKGRKGGQVSPAAVDRGGKEGLKAQMDSGAPMATAAAGEDEDMGEAIEEPPLAVPPVLPAAAPAVAPPENAALPVGAAAGSSYASVLQNHTIAQIPPLPEAGRSSSQGGAGEVSLPRGHPARAGPFGSASLGFNHQGTLGSSSGVPGKGYSHRSSSSSSSITQLLLQHLELQPSGIGNHIAACPADSCLWLVLLPAFAAMFDYSYSFIDQVKPQRWREGCGRSSLCAGMTCAMKLMQQQQHGQHQRKVLSIWEEQRVKKWLLNLAPGLEGLVLLLKGWGGSEVWWTPAWPGLTGRLAEAAEQAMKVREGRGGEGHDSMSYIGCVCVA